MSVASWLNEDIQSPGRIDCILLVLSFASAMIDTMTVPTVKVFVANNTGNLLFLGLGAAGLHKQYPDLVFPDRAAVALVAAWVGSFVTGRLMHLFGKRKRIWIVGEFVFESLLIFISTILLYTNRISITSKANLVLLFLLGWSFGAQSVVTKTLGVPAIPAQVVTGAMADLLSDPKLFAPLRANGPRNQRALFVLVFFFGAVVGGLILVRVNAELVLLLTAILKLVVGLSFFLVPGVKRTKVDEEAKVDRPEDEKTEKVGEI